MLLAICQVYIKQVNFAVTRYNFTIAIDEHRGIVKLSRQLRMAFYDTAAMHNQLMPAGFLLQEFNHGSGDRLRCLIKAGIGSKIGPELGETGELSAQLSS